jgi:diketogulonate reductase-like aldo/keto reductase
VPSTDPLCRYPSATYDEKGCRLSTWRALLLVQSQGKAKAVGVSNFNTTHLLEIQAAGLALPAVNQVHHNPLDPKWELLDLCSQLRINLQAYGSFGGAEKTKHLLSLPPLKAIAATHNVTTAQIVLHWQYQLGVTVNPGANPPANPKYMLQDMDIFGFELSPTEMDAIRAISKPHQ